MGNKTTRDLIVEAADGLFYRQGYQHTSFADIASAVCISRGNFYHHFRSKDDILAAVIDLRLEDARALLGRWEAESAHPADRIRSFIGILIVNRAKIMRHGCPIGTLCTELARLGHPSQADANALFALFHAWLRRQFERLARGKDADALALHLLARSQGVAMVASAIGDEAFVASEVRDMCRWLDACVQEAGSDGGAGRRPGQSRPQAARPEAVRSGPARGRKPLRKDGTPPSSGNARR
ncbi:TetR/AcrR family transcriptional regulator [Luteimonas sp. SJ-92]|uniref:TetR/AcrR family transcriptional regulator n=1 Tax=Luteimonas salinisoli TaxID=2752307 RepID=A0A853J7Y6_9GAMM|nr:TetR/AcrR family transcriptional regulator [Luteimonas salinisoli]NZA24854.1 TetR/AcrR family transcriptional regulator [Luteimonas salinisoli]